MPDSDGGVTPPDATGGVTPSRGDIERLERALERERTAKRDAEQRAAAAERALTDERATRETAISTARSEAVRPLLRGRLEAEVRASAAGRFRDPADALAHLPLDTFKVADDGTVDAAPITAALDKLLEAKPYLGVDGKGQPATPASNGAGSADQGARGGPPLDHNAALRQMFKDQTGHR